MAACSRRAACFEAWVDLGLGALRLRAKDDLLSDRGAPPRALFFCFEILRGLAEHLGAAANKHSLQNSSLHRALLAVLDYNPGHVESPLSLFSLLLKCCANGTRPVKCTSFPLLVFTLSCSPRRPYARARTKVVSSKSIIRTEICAQSAA